MNTKLVTVLCIFSFLRNTYAIIGGEDAKPHVAPFMVNIRWPGQPNAIYCGGVILQPNIILTAAICVMDNNITITAGDHSIHSNEISEQKRTVSKSFIHPEFSGARRPYSIAIIYLNADLDFNEFVQPIVLPKIDDCFTGNVIAYGWGQNGPNTYPNVLQKLQMQMIKRDVCREIVYSDFKLNSADICTGPLNSGKSMSFNDYGSPIIKIDDSGDPIVIGIMAFPGRPPTPEAGPAVHVNVAAVRDFIDDTLKNN